MTSSRALPVHVEQWPCGVKLIHFQAYQGNQLTKDGEKLYTKDGSKLTKK